MAKRRNTSQSSPTTRKPRKGHRPGLLESIPGVKGRMRFARGNPGRPKGSPDKTPGSRRLKASIKAIIEEVVEAEGHTITKALIQGIKGGPRNAHKYIELCAHYTDGKPADTMNLNTKYNEDELALARERLDKKVEGLVAAVLKRTSLVPGEGD